MNKSFSHIGIMVGIFVAAFVLMFGISLCWVWVYWWAAETLGVVNSALIIAGLFSIIMIRNIIRNET